MTKVLWMSENNDKLKSQSPNLEKYTRLRQSLVISYLSVLIISDDLNYQSIGRYLNQSGSTDGWPVREGFFPLWVPLSSECGQRYFGSQRQFASCCPASLCWGQIPVTSWLSLSYHDSQTLFANKFLGNFIFQSLIIHYEKTDDTSS